MKLLWTLCTLLGVLVVNAPAAESSTNSPALLSAAEAKQHIGQDAVVTGKVAEVNISERVVRLNFGQPFPKQPFTAVIFSRNTNKFTNLPSLQGKSVEVTGKITEYRNRPEMILDRTNQLKIIESKPEQ